MRWTKSIIAKIFIHKKSQAFIENLSTKKASFTLFLVAGPLLLGFGIYFACRTSTLLYYQWIPLKHLFGVNFAKDFALRICRDTLWAGPISRIAIFSAPAAMFAFSFTYYLKARYLKKALSHLNKYQKFAIHLSFVVFIAYFPELLQQVGAVPGYFDISDVITAALATVLALYIF